MVEETIFTDSDNEVRLILIDPTDLSDPVNFPRGKPYDFISNGVTLMELFINSLKFSSADGDISFYNGGLIIIKLGGDNSIAENISFSSSIKVYDATHPNGQFIVSNTLKNAQLKLTKVDPLTC